MYIYIVYHNVSVGSTSDHIFEHSIILNHPQAFNVGRGGVSQIGLRTSIVWFRGQVQVPGEPREPQNSRMGFLQIVLKHP